MATLKIKMEDKAAFLNRMEKQGMGIDSTNIKDNKLDGTFEVEINDPVQLKIAKEILKSSPKINDLKETLRTLIRQELKK